MIGEGDVDGSNKDNAVNKPGPTRRTRNPAQKLAGQSVNRLSMITDFISGNKTDHPVLRRVVYLEYLLHVLYAVAGVTVCFVMEPKSPLVGSLFIFWLSFFILVGFTYWAAGLFRPENLRAGVSGYLFTHVIVLISLYFFYTGFNGTDQDILDFYQTGDYVRTPVQNEINIHLHKYTLFVIGISFVSNFLAMGFAPFVSLISTGFAIIGYISEAFIGVYILTNAVITYTSKGEAAVPNNVYGAMAAIFFGVLVLVYALFVFKSRNGVIEFLPGYFNSRTHALVGGGRNDGVDA